MASFREWVLDPTLPPLRFPFAVVSVFSGIESLVGSASAADTLIGPDTDTSWTISSAGDGKTGTFTFSKIENLAGGSGVDVFKFSSPGSVSGSINGGGAPLHKGNWLDYSGLAVAVTVNLQTGAATRVAGGAAEKVSNIQDVHGGNGGNTLTGNSQGNILIGGTGADTITGGTGLSLLIGDKGADHINGGSGGDILIGDYTTYDTMTTANQNALMAILVEWQSADSYATRFHDINTGTGGGLNGTAKRWCRRNRAVASLTAAVLLLVLTLAIGSTAAALWLREALNSSEQSRDQAERASADANAKLWDSYLSQARAGRSSRRVGQRFASLKAVQDALRLPLPPGRSRDELRNEAIACLTLPDLRPLQNWEYPPQTLHVCFDGNLERYACTDRQGKVSVRRVADGRVIASQRGPGAGMSFPLLSPDGRFVAVQNPASARLKWWQVDKRAAVLIREQGEVRAFTFSPDSRLGAAVRGDGTVALYDLANGQNLRQMAHGVLVNPYLPQQLAFNSREQRLAVAGGTGVAILDLETGTVVTNLPQPEGTHALAWHPDGRTLAVAARTDVYLWNVPGRERIRVLREATRAGGIALIFSRRGDLLLTCEWSGTLRLWDPSTGQPLLSTPGRFLGCSFSLNVAPRS